MWIISRHKVNFFNLHKSREKWWLCKVHNSEERWWTKCVNYASTCAAVMHVVHVDFE
jgi:hypothetical protein